MLYMKTVEKGREDLLIAFVDAEKEMACRLILDWAKQTSFKSAFTDLLEPVLGELGQLWYDNKLSLAQAFLAGKVAEDVFNEASKSDEFAAVLSKSKGAVVLGNIEDDFHSFGRKLVAIFLRLAGWSVHDLGNDITAEEFVDKALETNARVIGVSAMIYSTAKRIATIREEIDRRHLSGRLQLCAGGAVFNLRPELVAEVGADGTAENAIQAPDIFAELQRKTL